MAEIKARSELELKKNKENAINDCTTKFIEMCMENHQKGYEILNNLKELPKVVSNNK